MYEREKNSVLSFENPLYISTKPEINLGVTYRTARNQNIDQIRREAISHPKFGFYHGPFFTEGM